MYFPVPRWMKEARSVRCVEGALYRHDPQHDDPYLETNVGQCPDCEGKGCEQECDE